MRILCLFISHLPVQIEERDPTTPRGGPLIVVEGVLQKQDGVLNILATHLSPLSTETEHQHTLYTTGPKARDFC